MFGFPLLMNSVLVLLLLLLVVVVKWKGRVIVCWPFWLSRAEWWWVWSEYIFKSFLRFVDQFHSNKLICNSAVQQQAGDSGRKPNLNWNSLDCQDHQPTLLCKGLNIII
jgi:hypothetical protein